MNSKEIKRYAFSMAQDFINSEEHISDEVNKNNGESEEKSVKCEMDDISEQTFYSCNIPEEEPSENQRKSIKMQFLSYLKRWRWLIVLILIVLIFIIVFIMKKKNQ